MNLLIQYTLKCIGTSINTSCNKERVLTRWIWIDDSDVKGFPVTGYINRCPIYYFKCLKSINLLRHSWRKRNINKLKEILPGTENHNFNEFEMTILIVLQMLRVSLLQDMLIDVQYTISSL
jgi:hypothetical protein